MGFILLILLAISIADRIPAEQQIRLNQADQLYYEGKYEEAIKVYQDLIEKNPVLKNMPKILVKLGRCYSRKGDYKNAHTYLALAVERDPDGSYASQAVAALASLYSQRYQYDKVVEVCRGIADRFPSTQAAATALYYVGNYLYVQGKRDEAIKAFGKLVEGYPSSVYRSSALSMLADLYVNRGEFKKAEELLKRFLARNPRNTDLARYLGDVYVRQERYDEAIRMLESGLRANPNDTSLIEKLGEAYLLKGERERAVDVWMRILNVSSYDESYRRQRLASIFKSHKMYDLAVQQYNEALKRRPTASYIYSQLADIYRILGDMEKAISTYIEAILNLGVGFGIRERMIREMMEITPESEGDRVLSEAIERIKNAIASQPNNPGYRLALIEVLFYSGDYMGALKELRELAGIYMDQGGVIRRYAMRLERRGKPEIALLYYREILNLFPTGRFTSEASLAMARIYMRIGRPDKGEEILRRMISRGVRSPHVYELLGEVQMEADRIDEALSTFKLLQTMTGGVKSLFARMKAAECLILLGRYDEAKAELDSLDEQPGVNQDLLRKLRGDWFFWQGMFDEAAGEYEALAEKGRDSSVVREALERLSLIKLNGELFYEPLAMFVDGMRYEKHGDPVKALTTYGMLLNRFPSSQIADDARYRMAIILEALGNIGEAKHILSQIASSGSPLAPRAQMDLAEMEAARNPKRAIDLYSKLIEKFPQSALAPFARRRIQELASSQP